MNNEPRTPDSTPQNPLQELVLSWGVDEASAAYPGADTLRALRESSEAGDEDSFELQIDDVTADFLDQNSEEYRNNIRIVRSRNAAKEEQYAARNRQRGLIALTREAISRAAGVKEEHVVDQEHQAREHIRQLLLESRKRDGEDFNALRTLGIVQADETGVDRFRFPKEIMPTGTTAKWRAYIDAVKTHIKAENAVRSGAVDKEELMRADQHRKIAHDSVTRDLMSLLNVPDFEEIRRTVAKMRDSSFPNTATSEEARVNNKLEEGLTVNEAMRRRLFPQGEYLPEPRDETFQN